MDRIVCSRIIVYFWQGFKAISISSLNLLHPNPGLVVGKKFADKVTEVNASLCLKENGEFVMIELKLDI